MVLFMLACFPKLNSSSVETSFGSSMHLSSSHSIMHSVSYVTSGAVL